MRQVDPEEQSKRTSHCPVTEHHRAICTSSESCRTLPACATTPSQTVSKAAVHRHGCICNWRHCSSCQHCAKFVTPGAHPATARLRTFEVVSRERGRTSQKSGDGVARGITSASRSWRRRPATPAQGASVGRMQPGSGPAKTSHY